MFCGVFLHIKKKFKTKIEKSEESKQWERF